MHAPGKDGASPTSGLQFEGSAGEVSGSEPEQQLEVLPERPPMP